MKIILIVLLLFLSGCKTPEFNDYKYDVGDKLENILGEEVYVVSRYYQNNRDPKYNVRHNSGMTRSYFEWELENEIIKPTTEQSEDCQE